jgi:hypothetical protein
MSGPPGHQPEQASNTPSAVVWYKVYAGLMSVLYLAVFAIGVALIASPAWTRSGSSSDPGAMIGGGIYAAIGLVVGVPFIVSLFVPPKDWVWVFDLVLICVGLLSCACWPFSIPLLITWLNPDVKRYFGA